jgi:hypothetical protein
MLWNGGGFININVATGASCPADGITSLFPLLISKLLPQDLVDALVKKASEADYSTGSVIPAPLIILGLFTADKNEAEKTAVRLLESCMAGGASDERGKNQTAGTYFNHSACAALLAVGGCMSDLNAE